VPNYVAYVSVSQNGDSYDFEYLNEENISLFNPSGIYKDAHRKHLGYANVQLPNSGNVVVKVYIGHYTYDFLKGSSMTKLLEINYKF
jgi:hypothetical protein